MVFVLHDASIASLTISIIALIAVGLLYGFHFTNSRANRVRKIPTHMLTVRLASEVVLDMHNPPVVVDEVAITLDDTVLDLPAGIVFRVAKGRGGKIFRLVPIPSQEGCHIRIIAGRTFAGQTFSLDFSQENMRGRLRKETNIQATMKPTPIGEPTTRLQPATKLQPTASKVFLY
jgi:hypothetical protein